MRGWTAIPLALVLASILLLPSVDAGNGIDGDLGKMYSMKVQFIFNGENADLVIWDFGDGTVVEERDPLHEFPAEGVYFVTQTAVNEMDGERNESVAIYRVEIMGYPELTFDSHGGTPVDAIQQTAFNIVAIEPGIPTREGYTFTGWYLDESLTRPMDWESGIRTDLTLHAGWTETVTERCGVDIGTVLAILVVTLAAVSVIAVLVFRRH